MAIIKKPSRYQRYMSTDKPLVEHNHHTRYKFVSTHEKDDTTSRVVTSTKKVLCTKDKFRELRVNDFAMENLQAIGMANLPQVSLSHDNHTQLSNIENIASQIINSSKTE